jgi:hypothetical protein
MKTTSFQALAPASIGSDTIFGVSVITLGVAKGHGLLIDETTLAQVVKCGNAAKSGIKVKVGHESGVEEIVGRLVNFRIEDEKVLADLQLFQTSPRRDFILELAMKTPESFGLSISFEGKPQDVDGAVYARCTRLRSVDLVDEPAANPDGLFEAAVDETQKGENPMKEEPTPEPMAEAPAPTVEERLATVEAAISEIKGMLTALLTEETTEAPETPEAEAPAQETAMSAKAEEVAGAAFEAVEEKILGAVETKFEALAALIKSFGTPVAPGVATEAKADQPTDFSELRKNPEAYRTHLIAKGILKP